MKIAVDLNAITVGDIDFSALEELGELKYFKQIPRGELLKLAADCDAIIINKIEIDREFLNACPLIKYVGTFATGYNVIDIKECTARGITVCNVPDYSTNSVSQHVFALLLAIYGRLREYSQSVDSGDWINSPSFCYFPWPTREISGKTFGILGYGNIGKSVAKIAEAFGANVVISTRTPPENCPYKQLPFEEMIKVSDIVSLHCPLTDKTEKIINSRTLSLMKEGAVLINTARGGLIDEPALAEALNSGRLFGAGLDVVAEEPMRADNPMLGARNCIITPHIAWVPRETRQRLLDVAAQNLKAYLSGKPQNKVNPPKTYLKES